MCRKIVNIIKINYQSMIRKMQNITAAMLMNTIKTGTVRL